MPNYTIGLDLGQRQDYTALIALSRSADSYEVRGIHRYERGTDYPAIVDDVNGRLGQPPLAGDTLLVVDATGVGIPVVDMFRRNPARAFPLLAVMITGGDRAHVEGGFWYVPKRDLVSAVQVLLQTGRLKFADVPLRAVLHKELQDFQVKITANAHDTYGAWREGQHDDLVLALALACWHAKRVQPGIR